MPRSESRLAQETSPYLLGHAQNPVDWYAWGPEAFERAKKEDKPVFLSIGYAACHWCHVMERESFENEAIAALLNRDFICIKVDREERPDIDDIYMAATIALHGSGGWPMNVFLTPDKEPFFAGTYFPPKDQNGRPGMSNLVSQIAALWKNQRKDLQKQAADLSSHIRGRHKLSLPGSVSEDSIRAACRALARDFDRSFGGFGGAPKFPPAPALSLLLRYQLRAGKEDLLQIVTRTLDGMMTGGIYDQLGGGFSRYSTDSQWIVPHFEKMLYDNAQLIDVYVEAFQATGHAPYRRVASESLDFVLREMQSPSGGFFSSIDADSEGSEGTYFVWTRKQIEDALGQPAATYFCAFYGVTDEGNFEGKNVLTTRRTYADVAKDLGVAEESILTSLEASRSILFEARGARTAPDVDDKVLTSWNGLMIGALANAARAFGDARYLEAAVRAAEFFLADAGEGEGMRLADGGLLRSNRAGRSQIDGFLEDYAFLADGLLSLYEAGAGARYLKASLELSTRLLKDFGGDGDALFNTSKKHDTLLSRPRDGHDAAIPNANAVACKVLARLAAHTGDTELRAHAEKIAGAFAGPIKRAPRAHCGMLVAADFLLTPPIEVVLSGSAEDEGWGEMAATLGGRFLPHRVETRLSREADVTELSALTEGRWKEGEKPLTYLCESHVCDKPIETASELTSALAEASAAIASRRAKEMGAMRLSGSADRKATANWAKQSGLDESAYTDFLGLKVSRFGLGSYRVGLDLPGHRAAVKKALSSGINFIDTSPSFALGDSERLIGQVIKDLADEGTLTREALCIVSKVGLFLGGDAEELSAEAQRRKLAHTVPLSKTSGDTDPALALQKGAFSLDPEFLRAQIETSIERLGIVHLDVCLIQSPEHLLEAGCSKEELNLALASAFAELESLVKSNKIGAYGVLSNTLSLESDDNAGLELEELLGAARSAGGPDHHFKVLEVPINLVESDALTATARKKSLAQRAKKDGLSLLACRPLSAMMKGALLRLAEPPVATDGATADSLKSARYKVASLEAEFETTFAAQLRLAGRASPDPVLPLSGALGQAVEQVQTRQQFELAEATMLTPRLRHLLAQLDRALSGPGDDKWKKFRQNYVNAVAAWLAAVREKASDDNRTLLIEVENLTRSSPVFQHLRGNSLWQESDWITRALTGIASADGLTALFVGLRSEQQVDAALEALAKLPALDQ